MKKKISLKKFQGFTLIEILVVITIIALLTSTAAITYSQLGKQSRDAKRKADLEQIRAALEMYRSDESGGNGSYFTYSGSCAGSGVSSFLVGNYIGSIPSDPKSNTYNYYCSIGTSTYSLGAYMETGPVSTGCNSYSCGTASCNYCVGPYGQK